MTRCARCHREYDNAEWDNCPFCANGPGTNIYGGLHFWINLGDPYRHSGLIWLESLEVNPDYPDRQYESVRRAVEQSTGSTLPSARVARTMAAEDIECGRVPEEKVERLRTLLMRAALPAADRDAIDEDV